MNGFKKLSLKDFIAIAALVGGIITSFSAVYVTATLSPYKQDLSVMDNKVEAYEGRLVKLEDNSVSQGERQLVLERLTRLENKVDNVYQLLLEK